MIPILYESSETEFVSEGLGRLSDAISCSVTEERNGSYELEMEYPVTGVHYSDIQLKRIISAIPADGKNRQSFVIYKISRPLDGKVTINAYHISYLLSGVITAPGSAKTVTEALLLLKNNALTNCPFEFWTDKETVANYSCDVPASIRSRLGGVTGSILDCYGGEYEWDNFTVKLHAHRGQDNGVRIAYGKNLTDIKQEESIESTVAGIYPYWKKDASDGKEAQLVTLDAPVYADNADNFPYKLVSVLDCSQEWQTAPTTDQLKAYAQSYIKNNDVGVPSVSIDVSFAALWQTEEYKNIAPLERVNLCDTVHVDFNTLGVSATAKVIETDYDVLSERYNSITIGNARASLSDTISNIESTATQTKKETTSFFQTAIANATKLIQGGLGGHVIFNTNADGQPNEILIMDTDDKNTAVNVIRVNVAGIGFSTTGYNGPFTTAWTINGAFNADFITAGTIRANLIKAGILQDAKGTNFWNLDTGEFRLQALSNYSTKDDTSSALTTAKSYADTASDNALTEAKGYADNVSDSALTTAKGYADNVSDSALTNAKSYADTAASSAVNAQTQESIFNKLTNGGTSQGIYLKDGKLYINGEYIKSGSISANLIKGGTMTSSAFMSTNKRTDEDIYRQLEIDRSLLGISSNPSKLGETLYNTSAVPRVRLGSAKDDFGFLELYDGNSTIEQVSGTTDIYHGKCGDNGHLSKLDTKALNFYKDQLLAGGIHINKDGTGVGLYGPNSSRLTFLVSKNPVSGRDAAFVYDADQIQFSEDGNFCGVLETTGGAEGPALALLADYKDTLEIGHLTSRTLDSGGRLNGTYQWSNNIKIDRWGVMHIYGTTKWGDSVTVAGNWTYTDSSGTKVQYFAWS